MAATFFVGLRQDSRSKMSIAGFKYTLTEMLSVMIYDKLNWLQWAKTKSGARGINVPQTLASKLFENENEQEQNEVFASAEEFEIERLKRIGGENNG